ncbi:MAG: mechanosensitive ion channel family protein [Wenzhouxiangella sp.]
MQGDRARLRLRTIVWLALLCLAFPALGSEEPAEFAPDRERLEALRSLDQAAGQEIATRLAAIAGTEKVRVAVSGGVVRLSGDVDTDLKRELAARIAADAPGVIYVDNQLSLDTDVVVRIAPLASLLQDKLRQLLRALPLLLAAILIVAAFWWFGGWIGRRKLLLRRAGRQPFLGALLRQAVRLITLLIGLLVALDLLNATALLGALLGTAGIVGIAFGFAFRDVAENYIAGVLLSLRQPFLPNDHVVIDGHEGRVAGLNSRATLLLTLDGNHLRLPNAQVFKGVILNYTRNPTRRFSFTLGVGNSVDLERVRDLGLETLAAMPDVLSDPKPSVLVADAADSSMSIRFSGWIDQRQTGFAKIRSEAIRLVKTAFDQAGIDMPDPAYRVEISRSERPVEVPPVPDRVSEMMQGDVSPEDHVSKAVELERAALGAPDLLDAQAPRE